MRLFQEIILTLKSYWAERGCIIQEPYDLEIGAGTMAPETFLRVLGPKPYKVAYVQPSRRPAEQEQQCARAQDDPESFRDSEIHWRAEILKASAHGHSPVARR